MSGSLIRSVLAAFGLAVACAAVSAVAADDAKPATAAKYVKLVHVATGKVLGIENDAGDAGGKAVLAKDEAKKARQWKLEKDGEQYKVVNRESGKVLDVFEASKDEGGTIIQWDEKADDTDNQRWSWDGKGEERRLKSKGSELVLDADGEKVVQKKADEKAKSQLWKVVEVKD